MIPLYDLVLHSLFYGLILSIGMFALLVGTLYWRPLALAGDAPPDIQAVLPSLSKADRRAKYVIGAIMLILLVTILGASLVGLRQLSGGSLSFAAAALSTFITFMTFNVVDLLIIDWLLVVRLRPRFVVLPGTEGMAGYDDYGFHFRGFLKGIVICAVFSLFTAAVAVVFL